MSTIREQILAEIATRLAPTAGVSGRVYRSRVQAFKKTELPAVLIEPVTDAATPYSNTDYLTWILRVRVGVILRGDVPDSEMDPILSSIHSLLLADRTIGNLAFDIVPESISFSNMKEDVTTGTADAIYTVTYRTQALNLEA